MGEDFVVVSTTSWLKHAVKTVQGGKKELLHQRSRMEQVTRPEEKSILTAHNLRCRFCGEYTLRTKEATSSVTKSLPTVTVSHCRMILVGFAYLRQ